VPHAPHVPRALTALAFVSCLAAPTPEATHDDLVAIRRYTEALTLDPTNGEAYLGLGNLRFKRGDLREAERVFDVALAHVPAFTPALVGRGKARWALGFQEQADDDFREFERLTDDPRTLKELADWYAKVQRPLAQLAAWRRIRALASTKGDAALEREAKTMVRALQIVVAIDPVSTPASTDPVRRGMARIARRGGG
jgi:tetratricopeptide (TPR) repeat protein